MSMIASWAMVVPPPEYLNFVPGSMSTRTGSSVCRLDAVQHLLQRGYSFVDGIAGKTVDGKTAGVTEQIGECDLLPGGELVVRQLPGSELVVDVLVKRDLSLLDFFQRDHRGHRLADRACLEQSLYDDWFPGFNVFNTVAARPLDLVVVDNSDAQTRHLVVLHPLLDGPARIALYENGRQQPLLHSFYARLNAGRIGRWTARNLP